MTPASRYDDLVTRGALAAVVGALAVAGLVLYSSRRIPAPPALSGGNAPRTAAARMPAPARPESIAWTVFARQAEALPAARAGALSKRFRLAGTFSVFGASPEPTRRAILDDARTSAQRMVSENDAIDDVRVVSILRDRVVLRDPSGEETLALNFSHGADRDAGGTNAVAAAGGSDEGGGPLNAFGGRRVGEFRWTFQRKSLLDYYQKLRDNPDRLVKIFDSLKPVYNAERRIDGYRLKVEGEGDFFDGVGFKEGDVVRKVNQMEMTSRARAEYFISEFVQDRANAFVIDVERDGKPEKLIYQVR